MLGWELKVALSDAFISSAGCVSVPSLARGPRGGCVAPRFGWRPAAITAAAAWLSWDLPGDAGPSGGMRLQRGRCCSGCRGKELGHPQKKFQFGFRRLVLSWLCHFQMIPLGQCGSKKFGERNLEGNSCGKRGGKETERRETLGSGWLGFLYILNFSSVSVWRGPGCCWLCLGGTHMDHPPNFQA